MLIVRLVFTQFRQALLIQASTLVHALETVFQALELSDLVDVEMDNQNKPRFPDAFRPQSFALALEQRILFDGAAAAAVDQQHHDSTAPEAKEAAKPATAVEARAQAEAHAPAAPRNLVVIDARVENRDQIAANLPVGTTALVVDAGQDAIAAISNALAQLGKVDSIQVFSHGASGQFTLGNQVFTSQTVDQLGDRLAAWRSELNAGADIQLYGCAVGAGSAGQALVNELARWTGADVGASSNATGSTASGGDWALEVRSGDVDKSIALSASTLDHFQGLLVAGPTTTLSGGADVLLGGTFTVNVTFTNISADTGYAPFIDLFFPATGKDGAGAEIDDGITFVSATYLGQTLTAHVITFDANGQARHPLAVGTDGQPLVINAADFGMQAGDQMVVLELPFSSVSQGQPAITVQVTALLSNLADTDFSFSGATPDLTIRARSGFQYGNDSLNNPATDPSILEPAANADSYVVHPTVITFDETVTTPEGETATGPNYARDMSLTITPANGQTLSNVTVTQPVPDNVIVTNITPAAGGTVTSVTLYDGRTITNALAIQAILALNRDGNTSNDLYIRQFTVLYPTLSGATDTAVKFYVPESDADGLPVINPATGDDVTITFGAPSASGSWIPLDPRDATNGQINFSGTGDPVSFIAKSITLQKQVSVSTDVGAAGLSPGDTLNYVLNIALSDYFAYGKDFFGNGSFIITDQLGDGQTLVPGSATLTIYQDGQPRTFALVATAVTNADGTTSLQLDIAQSLINALGVRGWLNGDLAFDEVLQGATRAVISYQALVAQSYTPPAGNPHSEINEGDSVGNNSTVTGTVLIDQFNLSGYDQSDSSSVTSTVPTSQVEIDIADLNGGGAPAPATELRPGDRVTFNLSYDLVTGDYENFKLTAYLPLPLFNLAGLNLNTIWQLATDNTNPNSPTSVTLGPGNSLVFTFADYVNTGVNGSRISINFTLTVSDQPFADQRAFNVLGESSQTRTLDKSTLVTTDDVTLIASVAEPVLSIRHGVVSASHGSVTGTTGTWQAPGTNGVPFSGSVTDPLAVNGNITGIDAADRLRLATAIENSGGGNAYDVSTRITLPPGLSFVGGSLSAANLLIYRGDGTQMVAGVDYSIDNATNTITFIDKPGAGALLAGRPGTAADNSGANVIIITYDVLVSGSIAASATLQSTAELTHYASIEGGQNFLSAPLNDLSNQQVAAPEIRKNYAGGSLDDSDSSASHTTGANLVVGESMLYDIIVTLPEGTTQNLRIDDLIPPGMRLDTSFNGGLGYQIITTAGGALTANFGGNVTVSNFAGVSGTLGADGVDGRFTFSASTANGDNNTGNNSFVIRLRLVASNVQGNQAGAVLQNDAQLTYSDPDGDTPNGTTAVDRNVAVTGSKPSITIREPTLQLSQQLITPPGIGFDQGDQVDFSITISNGNSGTDYNAFDLSINSTLPTELDQLTLLSAIYTVNGVSTDIRASLSLDPNGRVLVNTGNIDLAKGGTLVITIRGVVNATGASVAEFDNLAQVRWTSLDGSASGVADPAGERTGQDGALNGGTLNDYRRDSVLIIPVAQGIKISRVGGMPDTPAANPTNAITETATIGEIIHYRAVVVVPEGNNPNYQLVITLTPGLTLSDIASMRIGFISDGGLSTSLGDLITSGVLHIQGNENSPEAQYLTADLSGASPTGVLNANYVTISTDANGNQVVTISMGNVTNADFIGSGQSDDDLEGIVVEFNARVANVLANQAGVNLGATVQDRVNGNLRATSNTLLDTIVEPSFSALDKRVTDFVPNPGGALGTATVTVGFTSGGGLAAYDVHLTDNFPGGSNYSLVSLTIGGTSYGPGNLPAGVTFSGSGGLTVDFARIDPGTQVSVVYRVDVPNGATIASTDATLSWSSLPESFTNWGGSTVGADGTATGERTGADGVGPDTSTLNNYVLREGAGLGIISGVLWNDTNTAATDPNNATPDPDPVPGTPAYELAIANQTVNLVWAGNDGVFGNADDRTYSTTTNANGQFTFGVLPAGLYRIDAPGTVNSIAQFGELRIRIDTDGGTLGQVQVTLGEGAAQQANSGYVEINDAPVNTLPGFQQGQEDTPLAIPGIRVADVDAERDPDVNSRAIRVTLTVTHGNLSLTGSTTGVSVDTSVPRTLVLEGRITDINAALAGLSYLGDPNFNGNDFLQVTTNDLGNYGDFDGNGVPGELTDARQDQDFLVINLAPVNDPPTAVDDKAIALEAGGHANQTIGINPRGNLLDNDTDIDIQTNDDQLYVVSVTSPLGVEVSVPATGITQVIGRYGTLVISADGAFEYQVDNNNPLVEALRLAGQTLTEDFTYVIADIGIGGTPLSSQATLQVVIQGANDTPVAVNDTGTAIEAGGVDNSNTGNPGDNPPTGFPVPGSDATGNVLTNDTDVDSVINGETKAVTGIRPLRESVPGALVSVPTSGTVTIDGTYGTLTIDATGQYTYVINNDATAVQRLGPNDTLIDYFSYQVTDAGKLNDLGELRITIRGNYDNPVASDDAATAQAGMDNNSPESNPTGNVILFPSRPGNVTDPGGNGVDTDVDRADRPSSLLQVNGVRNGPEAGGGTLTAVSGAVDVNANYAVDSLGNVVDPLGSSFGTLTINPDGSFTFDVNSENAAIIALPRGIEISVIFTYQVVDTAGLTDTAQLVITVRGANNPPQAQLEVAIAIEAGGVDNGTPGLNPGMPPAAAEQVTFVDPDNDPTFVTAIRTGGENETGTAGTVGGRLLGTYGWLTIQADGTYTYEVNNTLAAVQALRSEGDLLFEAFTYTVTDSDGESDSATIFVVIRGQNDNPVATDDTATAVEAGGVNNSAAGVDPIGNVLTNDTDADGGEVPGDPVDYGETQAVSAVRTGATEGAGSAGTLGMELRGTYGWLTLNADGSYSYRLDNSMAAVQALRGPTDTLLDSFNYTLSDTDGATDIAVLNITIRGANDAPIANNDNAIAVEAGGFLNTLPGVNPSGNVLANDSDVDNGDTLSVTGLRQGIRAGSIGTAFAGEYGTLTLNADGSYTYVVDNSDPLVQALRTINDTLRETFTYTISDAAGATSTATLTVTIQGRNDNPLANHVSIIAVEAGGTGNNIPGVNPTINVLDNDTDVDASDTKTVVGIRTGDELSSKDFEVVTSAHVIAGTYGTLTILPNGQTVYVVNNDLPAVQALKAGDTLQEVFSYRMRDTASALSIARISVTIRGAWDAPVANDDVNIAVADNGDGLVLNPSGNVLTNDTDVDSGDQRTVTAVRTGAESGTGTAGTVGNVLIGQYGTLILNADGTYDYIVDSSNPDVQALNLLQTLVERFTYTTTDLGGLSDQAQLTIIIVGRNDPPQGVDDQATAIEAGGLNNATPGLNPSGNVLSNDHDLENNPLTVTAIRTGNEAGSGTSGTPGTALRGLYGTLTLQADGSWTYVVDNSLAAVQALRASGQTLTDVFTYTVEDSYRADDTAELRITIDGRNDTPIAVDDSATAKEAGGIRNGTAGINPTGNVLDNDTDVDSVANGETKQVLSVTSETGRTASAGGVLQGRYGTLLLNADGSYTYEVNNADPVVQALRTAGETLREVFTYRMRDTAGATSDARLTVTIQGANDNPVARDDSNTASDQVPAPHTSGNVLPNDSDVDGGDGLSVVGIRTGQENGSGTDGVVGQPIAGRYGTLVLNADGSYTYTIDLSNPEVLAAAGLGQILKDYFTYTISDLAGATDQALLTITLDISTPYIPPGPHFDRWARDRGIGEPLPDVDPAIFVAPVVESIDRHLSMSIWGTDGSDSRLFATPEIDSPSLGAQLGEVKGQFVAHAVAESRRASELDKNWVDGRHGVISLTADGLLPDPSLWAPLPADLLGRADKTQTAPGFRAQLREAAQRRSGGQ